MSILDNLVEVVNFRIGLASDEESAQAQLALQLALSAFNMIPCVTYFDFDDEENISQISDILVTYASYVLLIRKSLIEKCKEFNISDNGVYLQPPDISNHLITVSRELWNNWNYQVQELKQSDSFYEDFVKE
jgi:hypothetical protein